MTLTNHRHTHTVIKYFPKLRRLFMYALKKKSSHLCFSPFTWNRVDKILEESYSLLAFLFEKYLCMYVQFEKIHQAAPLWYSHFAIYTPGIRRANTIQIPVPWFHQACQAGRVLNEGELPFPFLNKYLLWAQQWAGPCTLHLHGQPVDHPLLGTCCHVCYSEKQLPICWGQETCLFTYLEHSLHGTHKTEYSKHNRQALNVS